MERVSISPANTIPNNFWTKTSLPAMSTTDNTYSHRNVLINDLIYIIGGGTSSYSPDNSVWVFDPNALTLNKDNNMVYTHRDPSSIAADNKIYVFSGAGTGYNYYEISNIFPTKDPTEVPTKTPIISPSDTPTSTPTMNPTVTPTQIPTKIPTETPTISPSDTPSNAPTMTPTQIPTEMPTKTPSTPPTKSSNSPTISTEVPSKNPTFTMNSTKIPTLMTKVPSNFPTKATMLPSINTFSPTIQTVFPSIFPSFSTSNPTILPTTSPLNPDDPSLTSENSKLQSPLIIIGCSIGCCIVILAGIAFYACYAKNKNLTTTIKSLQQKQEMNEIKKLQSSSHVNGEQQPGITTNTINNHDIIENDPVIAMELQKHYFDLKHLTSGNIKHDNLEMEGRNEMIIIQNDNIIAQEMQNNQNDIHSLTSGNISNDEFETKGKK